MRIAHLITTITLATSFALASLDSPLDKSRLNRKRATSPTSFNAGFNIQNVVNVAEKIASHSWEYGTLSEALLELYNPEYSIYSTTAFPNGKIPIVSQTIQSLAYAKNKFVLGDGTLSAGDGANGDPASLGVSAVLLGETNSTIKAAAASQIKHLYSAPRFYNGAISQRNSVAEIWADGSHMIMPYLAYYGAATQNVTMISDAANQILLYRNVLLANTTQSWQGLWVHIVGPQSQTKGIWATGNGWAALGMARVLAAMRYYTADKGHVEHHEQYIIDAMMAIFTGLTGVDTDSKTKLLRNYLIGDANSQDTHTVSWFGDASGSAALVAAALRLAVLEPSQCSFLYNASRPIRNAVIASINSTGVASPTVNPLNWFSTTPYTNGSPEGQSFIINMYSAWRDCVSYGCCPQPNKEPSQVGQKYPVWGGTTFTTSQSAKANIQTASSSSIVSHSSSTTTATPKQQQVTHSSSSSSSSISVKPTATSVKPTTSSAPKKRSLKSGHAIRRGRNMPFH